MRALESRAFLRGFAAFVLFTGLAADFWRNSISWYGYGAIVAAIAVISVTLLVRSRGRVRWSAVPIPLTAFLALVTLSIAWSAYPGPTVLGVVAQLITTSAGLAIALLLDLDTVIDALALALKAILSLSIAFELIVSLVIRGPVLPVWATAADRVDPPAILYWSRNNLLEGERIQGIVGSWSLLGMVAVLGIIAFGAQLAARRVRRSVGVGWIVLAVVTIVLTRSATIYLALAAMGVVFAVVLVLRRTPSGRATHRAYAGIGLVIAVLGAGAFIARMPLLAALGKSPDLTGRLDIWNAVIGLARERTVFGWGWVSFWPPWTAPFQDLVRKNGVMQLHAHNAWLDIWLQVGVVGLIVFGSLVATSAWRSWRLALDRSSPRTTTVGMAPVLLLTALLVQSLAESRLLVEGGFLLLVVVATTTLVLVPRGGQQGIGADRRGAPRAAPQLR